MRKVVIIPTVGRNSVNKLIQQIQTDAKYASLDIEIYVALNGTLEKPIAISENVSTLEISKTPIGVGETVNKALTLVPESLVWTIADDEDWLIGKFNHDIQIMLGPDSPDILSPIAYTEDELGKSVRPTKTIRAENVIDYLYANIHFGRNQRYFTLSGACANRDVWKRVAFPSNLQSREDTSYLKAQAELNTVFRHGEKPTVRINTSLKRSAYRDEDTADALFWALKNLTSRQFVGFLGCSWPKPHVLNGNFCVIQEMITKVIKINEVSVIARTRTTLLLMYWLSISLVRKISEKIIGFQK